MIRRVDYWIGTRLFHPPIIWLCHRLGMTQHAVARYAWMAAGFAFVMRIGSDFDGHGPTRYLILAGLIALAATIAAAWLPDRPTRPPFLFRSVLLLISTLDLFGIGVAFFHTGAIRLGWALAWDLFGLIGEYAKTIRAIPPREAQKKRPGRGIIRPAKSPPRRSSDATGQS